MHLLERMDPVGLQIIQQKHHAAKTPRNGVCPEDGGNIRPHLQRQRDIRHTDDAPAHQHGVHGHLGPARSPHHGGDAVGEGQCKVEQRLRPGLPYADGDDRRVIVEQGDGIGGHQQ